MNLPKLLVLTLLLTYIVSSAQVTNVRKWRKTEKDSLENGLFLYDERSYLQALPIFESIYNNHPSEEFIKYVYAKCGLYRSDKHEDSYTILYDIYQKNKRVDDIQYDLALAAHYNNKFDEALEYLTAYLGTRKLPFENRKKAELLKRYIGHAKYFVANPTKARVTDLGSAINSPDDEYTPAIKADESVMIFTYNGPKSIGGRQNMYLQADPNGSYSEDVYMSYKLSNEFTTAFPLDSLNTNAADAAVSLSNDGSVLFTYKNESDNHGDIYQSELVGEHYMKPGKLKGPVNSYSWDGHCSLSPDGKTLYFSSERNGGYGGRDIYKASLSDDGSWQHVVNLGDSINTTDDDDAPFIHPDGKTLFYSSKGRTSMGGYDVFKSVMSPDSTFKRSENLGYPINTTDDDIYFVLAANGENAYYSSGRKGGKGLKDIYQVEPNFAGPKPSLYLVKGEVEYDGDEVASVIKVDVISTGRAYGTFTSNASSGSYLISLPAGENYKLTYTYKEMPVQVMNVDLVGVTGYAEKTHNVDFKDQPVAPVIAVVTPTVAKIPEPVKPVVTPTVAPPPVKPVVVTPTITPPPVKPVVATPTIAPPPVKPVVVTPTVTPPPVKPVVTKTVQPVVKTKLEPVATATTSADTALIFQAIKDGFVPRTRLHEKAVRYIEKYGDINKEGLEFKVQISAFKVERNQAFPQLRKYGKIERVQLGDGYTRLYIGGSFKTLRTAFALTKRVVLAGQTDAFVSAFYKGKRLTYEELERAGIFITSGDKKLFK